MLVMTVSPLKLGFTPPLLKEVESYLAEETMVDGLSSLRPEVTTMQSLSVILTLTETVTMTTSVESFL